MKDFQLSCDLTIFNDLLVLFYENMMSFSGNIKFIASEKPKTVIADSS